MEEDKPTYDELIRQKQAVREALHVYVRQKDVDPFVVKELHNTERTLGSLLKLRVKEK